MEKTINLDQITDIVDIATQKSSLAEDYAFMHFTTNERMHITGKGPARFSGMSWILCLEGSVEVDINLQHYTIERNTLIIVMPDSIVNIKSVSQTLDCYTLVVSPAFMRTTNVDPNVLNYVPLHPRNEMAPMQISTNEINLLRHYFDLIHQNTTDNPDAIYVRSITRNLISAMLYQVIQFVTKRFKDTGLELNDTTKPRSRRSGYVKDFLALVKKYHMHERAVSFYAEKLFITTKYLSLLVKEATGRSAAQWIDEFVILEAKNMLRFSDKTIKQISNELNFANQSSFGKYFKLLTGMSPTEYQRS